MYYMLNRWGNTPAMDIVNLSQNEKNTKTDLSLAFVGWFSEFILSSTRTNII